MNHANRNFSHHERPKIPLDRIRFGNEIDHELYAGIAEEAAGFVAKNGKSGRNKSTQLRRFYDEICLWDSKINNKGSIGDRETLYKELAPFIKMLKAKIAYAKGRDHVDENFEKLLCHCIDGVDSPITLGQCKLFFEAFMGFYKAVSKD